MLVVMIIVEVAVVSIVPASIATIFVVIMPASAGAAVSAGQRQHQHPTT